MPKLEVKTVSANQIWASPDGARKIYELQLEWEGKPVKAKTYSDAIAAPGWSGTVETYEKPNNQGGSDTFVKQPPKEGGYGGSGGRSYSGRKQDDPFTMYLSYAKDLAVACVETSSAGKLKFNPDLYTELLEAVEAGGSQLFASRKEAQAGALEVPSASKPDEVTTEGVEEITVEDLSKAIGGESVDVGETPWPNQ